MLLKFESKFVPKKYSDDASRRAVLYPLTGPVKKVGKGRGQTLFDQLDRKVKSVTSMWRTRLHELKKAGWKTATKSTLFGVCLNCHPSLMAVRPVSLSCKQRNICPFCYARNVQKLYRDVSTVYKGLIRREDYWLIGYRNRYLAPAGNQEALFDLFNIEKNLRNKIYGHFMTAYGGYLGSEFEPIHENWWRVTRRGILLVSSLTDMTAINHNLVGRIKRMKDSKITKISKLVGWTMRYPVRLLAKSDPVKMVTLLENKHKNRLNASYGLFRKSV
jgi:hypothetical protein